MFPELPAVIALLSRCAGPLKSAWGAFTGARKWPLERELLHQQVHTAILENAMKQVAVMRAAGCCDLEIQTFLRSFSSCPICERCLPEDSHLSRVIVYEVPPPQGG